MVACVTLSLLTSAILNTDCDLRLGLKEALTRETLKRRRFQVIATHIPAGFSSFSCTNLCKIDPRKSPG
jgi:hypothetical protein